MAQVAEHILGKDEVTSSNLVISSINPRKRYVCGGFCLPKMGFWRKKERIKTLYW